MTPPALIALDWGTSNLRASLLDAAGVVLESRSAQGGVMAVKDGAFSAALLALCGDWLAHHGCPLIASGMVGSRQGWKEAPYLACPAGIAELAARMTTVAIEGAGSAASARNLHIAPGLQCADSSGAFDVMRGEETQIWGAALPALPDDQTYQLWGVIREQVISLGVLGSNPEIELFSAGAPVSQLVVTIEAAGGVVSNGNPDGAYAGAVA